jgi:hypothetical protein
MDFEYYYNNVPGIGQCRNNLIYTSLISKDKKTFVMWYHNDTEYHKGMNQVVDPDKMDAKWARELQYIHLMSTEYPNLIPKIKEIDLINKKIYLEIDGPDFWEQSGCVQENYENTLPNWKDQMLEIIQAHKFLGLYKFSMHPSSYFVIDGKLKSINYFFTYHKDEPEVTLEEHKSHISLERQSKMEDIMKKFNMNWSDKLPFHQLQKLCFESFRSNYPSEFIDSALNIYAK